jgi:hypothetical protein
MRKYLGPLLVVLAFTTSSLFAYPEFEVWTEKVSGKYIDCAMCHTHPDGPEGVKPGQIRSLSREELDRLNEARLAFEPGIAVNSPVLNAFGNRIVEKLGRKKFLEIRAEDPGLLVAAYGMDSDLDGDGIPDAREYMEGTSPVDSRSGNPWSLFRTNLRRYWLDVLMTILATLAGLYGLNHILRWFEHEADAPEDTGVAERETDSTLGYLSRRAVGKKHGR